MAMTFDKAFKPVRDELLRTLGRERLQALHRRSGVRHALVALRQLLLLALGVWGAWSSAGQPLVWIPASVLIGLVVFSTTVLLHEVVHRTVFARPHPRSERWLAFLYALPSGLSPSQFARWHLDHHRWLGTHDRDPKRAYLTPKRVNRFVKALYLTPVLFPIYLRAARRAGASYPPELARRIGRERLLSVLTHATLLALLVLGPGWFTALRVYVLPLFVVFPIAFTVNRLGQHYDVEPSDPARWGTLMRRSPLFWDQLFLWSNYHLEHHYFPHVPCYRLPALRRALTPFLEERGVPVCSYAGLLWGWFVRNETPHTDWARA